MKAAMNTVGFIFDLWLINPKNVKKIFVYCYDGNDNLTAKWSRDVIMMFLLVKAKKIPSTFYLDYPKTDLNLPGAAVEKRIMWIYSWNLIKRTQRWFSISITSVRNCFGINVAKLCRFGRYSVHLWRALYRLRFEGQIKWDVLFQS